MGHVGYAVIVGDRGQVVASANEYVAVGAQWSSDSEEHALKEIEAMIPIVVDGWLAGRVYVGMSREGVLREAARDRKATYALSIFLVLMAAGVAFGGHQMGRLRNTLRDSPGSRSRPEERDTS